MTASIQTDDLKRRMHGAVDALKHDLAGLRTGRASGVDTVATWLSGMVAP